MMDFRGKRVVVVGLGASGLAAARLLQKRGAHVVLSDAKSAAAFGGTLDALTSAGAELAVPDHMGARFGEADLIVVSPGVPAFPALHVASAAGVPIWGEIELATQALAHPAPIVAIGGTNGKSTVTTLVGDLLAAAGKAVFVGGNLGEPLADHVDEQFDVVVLEVSSFQMERVEAFRPHVSLLLNVSPDHLDRYDGLASYARAKGNAFERQSGDDVAIVPVGDAICLAQAKRGGGRVVTFGPGGDVDLTDESIHDRASGFRIARGELGLVGEHNAMNVAAALAAVASFGVSPETVRTVLRTFRGLPHRMAFVSAIAGVRFYDDSKGTNVGAAETALRGLAEEKAVLIAGGKDKHGGYAPLVRALQERGRAVVVIGEAAQAIADAVGNRVPVTFADTMEDAVTKAHRLAKSGDAVLLSPACASFDMFKDYKHRGDVFVAAVRRLEEEESRA